jgi:hypothetical protein
MTKKQAGINMKKAMERFQKAHRAFQKAETRHSKALDAFRQAQWDVLHTGEARS